MRILSVSEFADFCKAKKSACYIYATQNQQDHQNENLRLVLRFPTVIINLKPDRICFTNGRDRLSVEGVKSVQVFDEAPCVGTVFKIRCVGKNGDVISTWLMD